MWIGKRAHGAAHQITLNRQPARRILSPVSSLGDQQSEDGQPATLGDLREALEGLEHSAAELGDRAHYVASVVRAILAGIPIRRRRRR